jgi:Flagellar biosynthesis pathway, component FliP
MRISLFILGMFITGSVSAETLPIVTVTEAEGETQYSLTLQLLALMTLLSLLPAMLLGLTSFIRIIIVLSLLRQALGTMQTPPNQSC